MFKLEIASFTRINFLCGSINKHAWYVNKKLLQGLKKLCKNSMVIRHAVKELAKYSFTQPMKYIVEDFLFYVGLRVI